MLHNISGRLKCGPAAIPSGVIPLIIELLTVPKVEFDTVLIDGTVLARGYHFSQGKKWIIRSLFAESNFYITGCTQIWTYCNSVIAPLNNGSYM